MTSNRYPHLLSPGRIGTMELKNRIAVTAMGMSLSEADGHVGERLIAYHEEQAKGGAGLVTIGVAGVAWPVGAACGRQTAISDDKFLPGLTALTERVHRHGAKVAAQLHHAGPGSLYSTRWGLPIWAPALPQRREGDLFDYFLPEEMAAFSGAAMPEIKVLEQADIDLVVRQFGDAAGRARRAGFDGIEIHSAHGYLLSSFISPKSNSRTDGYGGPLENRMRLLLEVLAACRKQVGADFPIWVKLDSREVGKVGGITIEDAKRSAKMVEAAGADAITVSSYHDTMQAKLHSESNVPHIEDTNLPATAAIKAVVSIPVIGSGRIEMDTADRTIGNGGTDFVAMGRKLLADPHLPNKLAAGMPERVRPCIYCYTCVSAIYTDDSSRCAVNSALSFEFERNEPGVPPKHVAVIGGGPGGMESARQLAGLGHKVTLIEQSERLGGTLRFAALVYEPNERLLNWLRSEVAEAGVDVRLGTTATPELLRELGADDVIVATGAIRGMPVIPGNDLPHVFSGDDMRKMMFGESSDELKRKTGLFTRLATKVGAVTGATANLDLVRKATRAWMPIGTNVVIIGGELVGVELAEFLIERGRKVTVVDEMPRFGKGLTLVRRLRLMSELKEHGVTLATGAQDIAIEAEAVTWTDDEGRSCSAPADTVIVAKGAEGDLSLAKSLRAAGFNVHAVGDANGVGYIEGAMRGAAKAVGEIAGGVL
jgi:2,4-dienoyl-CoA reductase-like NADH-dependent reductase (Old Yellow Enzyme family)/NADPH-dependent 2,4-dienoyl-CoA reductase/sulfur reductase-like enzyme